MQEVDFLYFYDFGYGGKLDFGLVLNKLAFGHSVNTFQHYIYCLVLTTK